MSTMCLSLKMYCRPTRTLPNDFPVCGSTSSSLSSSPYFFRASATVSRLEPFLGSKFLTTHGLPVFSATFDAAVSNTCPKLILPGTVIGFMRTSTGPSLVAGISSSGITAVTTPLFPWRPVSLSPTTTGWLALTRTWTELPRLTTSVTTPGTSLSQVSAALVYGLTNDLWRRRSICASVPGWAFRSPAMRMSPFLILAPGFITPWSSSLSAFSFGNRFPKYAWYARLSSRPSLPTSVDFRWRCTLVSFLAPVSLTTTPSSKVSPRKGR